MKTTQHPTVLPRQGRAGFTDGLKHEHLTLPEQHRAARHCWRKHDTPELAAYWKAYREAAGI